MILSAAIPFAFKAFSTAKARSLESRRLMAAVPVPASAYPQIETFTSAFF